MSEAKAKPTRKRVSVKVPTTIPEMPGTLRILRLLMTPGKDIEVEGLDRFRPWELQAFVDHLANLIGEIEEPSESKGEESS